MGLNYRYSVDITAVFVLPKPFISPTNQRFSKLQKIFDILFLDGDLATKCRADLTKILSKFVLDICMISQPIRVNLDYGCALLIFSKPHFSGILFDNKAEAAINFIYPFDTCNNSKNFENFDYLNISPVDFFVAPPFYWRNNTGFNPEL